MLLACKYVDATKSPEAGITPSDVACGFGHEYIVDLLSGYMDHNHDILTRGSSYPRDGEDQGFVHGPLMENFTVKPQVEAGCMDHNHDIVDQGFVRGPRLRGTKDQSRETQWSGNLKQNLDRSAVASPVEDNIPAIRTISVSKIQKITLI